MKFESKLPEVGTTIFTIMSTLATQHNAINLSQGFPNFDCDEELKDLVIDMIRAGKNQYAPMPGVPALREAIANKIDRQIGLKVDPNDSITITAGATQALYTAIAAVIRPGDNAIQFDPAYDAYGPSILSFGGTVTPVTLNAPTFDIDWNEVESKITPKTKLIVINTPHNPLGKLLRREDMLQLGAIAERHDLFILSDEVYEHLTYDGLTHESALKFDILRDRTFAVFSFGKTYHATGWKMGYCVAPKALMTEFRKMHQFIAFAINTPIQHALSIYLKDENKYLSLPGFFERKRNLFLEKMANSAFTFLPSEGSYFILADYSNISDQQDLEFAKWLTIEHGVATIPLSSFYINPPDSKIVRFCFAKTDDTLVKAAERLSGI